MLLKQAYKNRREQKDKRIEIRLDNSLLRKISKIRDQTGVSISEIVRTGIRLAINQQKDD